MMDVPPPLCLLAAQSAVSPGVVHVLGGQVIARLRWSAVMTRSWLEGSAVLVLGGVF